MKIIGAIFLILGLIGVGTGVLNPPPKGGTAAYQSGYQAGRIGAPVVLIGLGLGLLLRRNPNQRPAPARPASAGGLPPRASAPPAVPLAVPVKIYCGCGQHYAFDVQPVNGRMPAPVACPACGADGTEAANAAIAQTLATRVPPPSLPASNAGSGGRNMNRAVLVGVGIVVMLIAFVIVFSVVRRAVRVWSLKNRPPVQSQSPAGRPNPAGVMPSRQNVNAPPASKAGSLRDAAPVPADMTAVDVFWGGRWWPATILKREGPRAHIHYDGWNASHDEWVTPERMRPRR